MRQARAALVPGMQHRRTAGFEVEDLLGRAAWVTTSYFNPVCEFIFLSRVKFGDSSFLTNECSRKIDIVAVLTLVDVQERCVLHVPVMWLPTVFEREENAFH